MLRQVKPKNARAKRALEKREPKTVEDVKIALFLRGTATSQISVDALSDLYALKKPAAVNFQKKNAILPFEDTTSLDFLSEKNDAAFAVLATHNKKRPHNLTWVRFFDHKVMDMMEMGISNFKSIKEFSAPLIVPGTKPLIIFQGSVFDNHPVYRHAKSLFLDFFRGETIKKIDSAGLTYVVVISAADLEDPEAENVASFPKINFRVYNTKLLKTEQKLPRVELVEMGPRMDLSIRRIEAAQDDVLQEALKKPKSQEVKTKKNIDVNPIGDKVGRIHIDKQDLNKLQTRKMKGLKRGPQALEEGDEEEEEMEGSEDEEEEEDEE
ncbi:brix domain-containing protein Rpf2 [Schizosaccharomyces japonicus yFS275]|uniref:Ribosome production factor 2 homolog n=1 Tax=Schizosaccharomyces japonicus (strain yFS275 / FY16936) TaxID=402676 RepID=B6K5Y2_SCHJY|nr:brix domain-containing protein Rpf2 [Schizosaccharomyces japonicus yFS275]EEB08936.1 brix domain-containing protein Rpf2 [Schizosaccharomyces japonicus yFS275]